MAKKRKRNIPLIILSVIIDAAVVILTVLLVYTAVCNHNNKIPFVLSNSFLHIKTKSMETTIHEGDYIGVNRISPEDIKVGDIIVFNSRDPEIYGYLNTHRVAEICYGENGELIGFITKGDNNVASDEIMTLPGDAQGIYTKTLAWLTHFENIVSKRIVIFLLFLIPALSLSGIIVRMAAEKADKRRIDKREELFRAELDKLRKNGLPPDYKTNEKTDQKTPDITEEMNADDGGE